MALERDELASADFSVHRARYCLRSIEVRGDYQYLHGRGRGARTAGGEPRLAGPGRECLRVSFERIQAAFKRSPERGGGSERQLRWHSGRSPACSRD